MPTIRLTPSTYQLSSTLYLSISNAANMYTNTDSTTYATLNNTQRGTTAYYIYIRGFNFSDVPSDAIINSVTVKVKVSQSQANTSTTNGPVATNGTTVLASATKGMSTSATVYTIPIGNYTFANLKSYGSNFGIRLANARNKQNTASTLQIYGAQILVDYTVKGANRTITASCSAGGTITPNGTLTIAENTTQRFTIKPNSNYVFSGLTVDGNVVNCTMQDSSTYIYDLTVTSNHILYAAFDIMKSGLHIKINGTWQQAYSVYKKVNGSWVLQSNPSSIVAGMTNGNRSGYTYGGQV